MLKTLAVFCSAIFIMLGATTYAQEETALTPEQELLVALDIIELNSYGEIDNDQEVTRADFADVCGKLLNINPTATANKAYFTDVTPDDWYAYTVNTLAEMGIISQSENKLFEPDRTITFNEAIKMLDCVMGYGEYAQSNGGYPAGYLSVASSQGLLDGVENTGDVLTKGTMTKLLYNALHANVMKKEYNGAVPSYVIDDNETLMSYYMDIYEDRGVVEAVYGMSLTDYNVPDGQIRINGADYNIGDIENASDYLGYQLKFYYRSESDDSRTLVYIEPFRMSEFTILSDDIEEFGGLGGQLTYLDGSRSKHVDIASDATVVRNGEIVKENVDQAFQVQNGEMKLVDGDNNGSYEVVMIYDYETIVVNTFDQGKGILTDAIDHQLVIDISECFYINVFSETGDTLDLSAITSGTVIDIAYSSSHAFIYVNSNNFEGRIDSINSAEHELSVDGVTYKYLDKAFDYYYMKTNYAGLFKTNKFGKIAYFEISGSDALPGYVVNVAYTDELQETLMAEILTSAGEVEWIDIDEDARLDGSALGSNIDTVLPIKEKVVLYNINSEGKIIQIDSPTLGGNEDETSLSMEMALNTEGHRWMSSTRMFDRNVICSPDMIIFKVPPATSSFRDDDAYTVVTTSAMTNNKTYQAEAYKYGKTSYCNIVVLYETKYTQASRDALIIVTQVNEGVNEQNDEVYYIKGYQKGAEVTLELERPHDIVPKRGDCIRIGKDKNGKVGLIEIHYDIERNGSGMCDPESYWYWAPVNGEPYDAIGIYWNGTFRDLQADFRLGFGYPVEVDGEILKWSFTPDSDSVDEIALVDDSTPITIYEADTDTFYEGTLSDVKTQEMYGNDCSIVVASYSWGVLDSLYVVNNRSLVYDN